MVVDISHKATLGWKNNIVQLRKWNPMFNHSLNIALINATWNEKNWIWLTKHSPSNSKHMEKYSRMEQWCMPNFTHM
jgi:hypothetical protein